MFLVLEARISSFYLTELLELNQEKSGNIPAFFGKHFSKNSELQDFRNFGNLSLPLFDFLEFRIPGFLIIENDEFLKMMKSRRRGMS